MSGIFLIQDDKNLVEMTEQPYDSEARLQELLAKYPNLLAGDQMDSESPRRWLLVSREMPVFSEEDGTGRWSLDHLFLDQDAIPTLVEVKRSSDTRIRREVVGQMLDYAANAIAYWPVEAIRAQYERTCQQQGVDSGAMLAQFLGENADIDQFWQKVKTNLQAGRIRMVFVADEIPAELRRIVEFLNGQMDPAEVLAVEIKQYIGGSNQKTLVPRVIGLTSEAERKKSAGGRDEKQWDEPSFFQALTERTRIEEAGIARKILQWAKARNLQEYWGKGSKHGSFYPILNHNNIGHYWISIYTYGRINVQFGMMQKKPPFDNEGKREELRIRLNRIPGIDIPADGLTVYPGISLATLSDDAALQQFLDTLDWCVQETLASSVA